MARESGEPPSDARSENGRPRRPRPVPPPLPPELALPVLAPEVRNGLRELNPERRQQVASHLSAAAALLDGDPAAAYAHATYARSLAARIPATREAAGVTAYRLGRYAEALSELRACQRMTGAVGHLPVLADCERGLNRPRRALALAGSPEAARLGPAERIELRIVASGARRDLGEVEAALVELRCPELDATEVAPWTARLWYAYAEALLAAGRRTEAASWFSSAAAVDEYDETDAEARAAELANKA